MKPVHLLCAIGAIAALAASAQAGDYYQRGYMPPAPSATAGTVNNFYAPVTIYNGAAAPAQGYDYSSASPYGSYGYSQGDAGAYADSYGYSSGYGSYDPYAGGVGYSPYGYGYGYGDYGYGAMTPPVYDGARMDPWNGYNAAPGNGYW